MTAEIEFCFDFGSPNAYLVHKAIPAFSKRLNVSFRYVPILLGGIFKATNNVSPAVSLQGIKNKPEYSRIETERFLARYQVDAYLPNPNFPVNSLMMMRGATFARDKDYFAVYVDAMYHSMWGEPKKMDEPEIFIAEMSAAGLPAEEIMAGIGDPDVKQQLIDQTGDVVERGAFGSPTFFYQGEIYFGKEKLRDLEDVILGQ